MDEDFLNRLGPLSFRPPKSPSSERLTWGSGYWTAFQEEARPIDGTDTAPCRHPSPKDLSVQLFVFLDRP